MSVDYNFDSAEEAVAFCRELKTNGSANLFRGQAQDWPTISPSLLRGDEAGKENASLILEEFGEWANAVPQMSAYWEDPVQQTAIAQHYGLPTPYLDLTTDPEIAAIFATQSSTDNYDGQAVIYCFQNDELRELSGFLLHEIDVVNLWRLKSQKGVFVEFLNDANTDPLRQYAIRLHFPLRQILPDEHRRIYPPRKSALEIVIDQWMYRHRVTDLLSLISGTKYQLVIKRYTYPGVFRWREVPEFEPSWINWDAGWVIQNDDEMIESLNVVIEELSLPEGLSVVEAYGVLSSQVSKIIERYNSEGKPFEFKIVKNERAPEALMATTIMNWCWDGLRVHPYSEESVVRSLSSTALALLRRIENPDEDWEGQLWGETESIDIAPVGGHLDSGAVSKETLLAAFHSVHYDKLTAYARRSAYEDPLFLSGLVVDPWILFDFSRFSRMFVEEFIPSCVGWFLKSCLEDEGGELSALWAISFNPALLGFVTLSSYRFYSPIATESDVDHIVLLSSGMGEDDIEECFISCMPSILSGGAPYSIKFADHAHDDREIWEIPDAIDQCDMSVRVGGISVLDVFTNLRDPDLPEIESSNPWDVSGLGAFHVWAIGTGRFDEINGKPFGEIREIFEEFYAELVRSNQEIERRAKGQKDWPLVVS